MDALRRCLIALTLLAPGTADAQAHGPSVAVTEQPAMDSGEVAAIHEEELVELHLWLRRLVGQYRIEGIKDPGTESALGVGNCIGIGTGPGMQCMINLSWPSSHGEPARATHAPAMILYGIDTQEGGIRSLQVSSKSIAEAALGFLNANVVTFKLGCVNASAWPPCRRSTRMEAAPAGTIIYIWDETEIYLPDNGWIRVAGLTLSLRRVPEGTDAATARRSPTDVSTIPALN